MAGMETSMAFVPHVPRPEKDEDVGAFRCKECGALLTQEGWYCDDCQARRNERAGRNLRRFWWLILLLGAVAAAGLLKVAGVW